MFNMNKRNMYLMGWSMWFLAALFYGLDYFQHTAPSVLLKPISESLGINIIHIGDIMSIYFPIYAISQLPAGFLLDKFGPRLVLSIACMIVSIGLIFMAIAHGDFNLILGRSLIAVGSAFAFLGTLKVAADWLSSAVFPIAVGLTNSIGVLGGMFGQVLLNSMVLKFSWQSSLWYIAFFGIGLSIVLMIFLKNNDQVALSVTKGKILRADMKLLKSKQLWLLSLYAGIMVGTVVNAFSELYDVVFLEYAYGIGSEKAALISSMIFVGIAVGGPLHSTIAKFFGSKKRWMVIANLLTIILFGFIAIFHSYIPIKALYPLYFFLGFCVSSMLLAFAIGKDIFPENVHGLTMAVINMVIGLCGALFQPLLGELFFYLKGGLEKIHNPNTFSVGFMVLFLPLILSFICCLSIKGSK
jgi:MFS family permease